MRSSYETRAPGILMTMFRMRPRPGQHGKLTQNALAALVQRDPLALREWESGVRLPQPESLMRLIQTFLDEGIFLSGKEHAEAKELWEAVRTCYERRSTALKPYPPFDEAWFEKLLKERFQRARALAPTGGTPLPFERTNHVDLSVHTLSTREDSATLHLSQPDWGDIVEADRFYGREQELGLLEQWMLAERCRVVMVQGMGGIGKTALAIHLAHLLQEHFVFVICRSLYNALPFEEFFTDCLVHFSNQQSTPFPGSLEKKLSLLLQYVREVPCLIILDNIETVLQEGAQARVGAYREGYEGYGRFLQLFAESVHQSCLLLTGREKPKEVDLFEGKRGFVRSLSLTGLGQAESQMMLQEKELLGPQQVWDMLVRSYSGNPLALKLVSGTIREVFDGDIAAFLAKGKAVFGDIRDLLDQQFARLSSLEKRLLYWLVIEREMITQEALQDALVPSVSYAPILEALDWLIRRRSWIERGKEERGMTLQPVIMEYVTDHFIEQICQEIEAETYDLLISHPLLLAQAKDYVRSAQTRLILAPIAERLLARMGRKGLEAKLTSVLATLRENAPLASGYAAANVIHVLCHVNSDLKHFDFSHLTVWQAYLCGIHVQGVNFSYADLTASVFAETFSSIISLTFSPDGKLLVAGTANGEVRLRRIADGAELHVSKKHRGWVMSLAFSPDGSLLASASSDQTIKLWDHHTGRCCKTLQGHTHWVSSVVFSPDGVMLASCSYDGVIKLWNIPTGQCLRTLKGHTHWVSSVAFSPDGDTLASGSYDATVKLWDVHTGQCQKTLHEHCQPVRSVAFSPDGGTLASGSEDQTIKLWRVSDDLCSHTLQGHIGKVMSVSFSPDGQTLCTGDEDAVVRLWNVQTGACYKVLQGHTSHVWSVVFSPDGSLLASGGYDQAIKLWDSRSGQCLKTWQGHINGVRHLAFNGDGSLLASGHENHKVYLWDVRERMCCNILQGHTDRIRSLAFSPGGQLLASSSEDRMIKLWSTDSGACLKTLQGHTDWVTSLAFSPDGTLLASSSDDQTIRLWKMNNGECYKTLQSQCGYAWSVAFSPDGTTLASGGNGERVRLFSLFTEENPRILQGHSGYVFTVAFSPDGSLLASGGSDQTIKLWDMSTGRCCKTLSGHTGCIRSLVFSRNGETLASGSSDQTIKLWDMRSRQCYKTLLGHTDFVRAIAFSPDNALLASGSQDETVKLWDIQTGTCVETLRADRPYERMNITGVVGLTEAQKASLKELGAIEDTDASSKGTALLLSRMETLIPPPVSSQREQRDEGEMSRHEDHSLQLSNRSREATEKVSLPPLDQASLKPLSKRELQILLLIAQGESNQEIASHLVVAPSTVKSHLKKIYEKLSVHSRTQAIARARASHLL